MSKYRKNRLFAEWREICLGGSFAPTTPPTTTMTPTTPSIRLPTFQFLIGLGKDLDEAPANAKSWLVDRDRARAWQSENVVELTLEVTRAQFFEPEPSLSFEC